MTTNRGSPAPGAPGASGAPAGGRARAIQGPAQVKTVGSETLTIPMPRPPSQRDTVQPAAGSSAGPRRGSCSGSSSSTVARQARKVAGSRLRRESRWEQGLTGLTLDQSRRRLSSPPPPVHARSHLPRHADSRLRNPRRRAVGRSMWRRSPRAPGCELDAEALAAVQRNREALEEILSSGTPVYGISTGLRGAGLQHGGARTAAPPAGQSAAQPRRRDRAAAAVWCRARGDGGAGQRADARPLGRSPAGDRAGGRPAQRRLRAPRPADRLARRQR